MMRRDDFRFSVGHSSARTFALNMTGVDATLFVLLAVGAGCAACAWSVETILARRMALGALAAISAGSMFVIMRTLVPFVVRFSYAHMMRLRLPFYLWTVSLIATALLCGASGPYRTLAPTTALLALGLAALAETIRFFQTGSCLRLALAFGCAGAAFGFSAMGAGAMVLTLLLEWFMARRILDVPNCTWWTDPPRPGVVEYFTNPLVRSRMKWVLIGCSIACASLAFLLLSRETGDSSEARHAWRACFGLDGVVFLTATAILPLVIGLDSAGRASDVAEDASRTLPVYLVLMPLSALFMLKPEFIPSLIGIDLRVEPALLAAASVIYVFNLLLAGVVVLADIRCRDFRDLEGVSTARLRNVMLVVYAVGGASPLALVACAVYRVMG